MISERREKTMANEAVSTENAPAALGPYSQAIKAGGFVFTAGMVPIDPKTGKMPDSIEDQTKQVIENVTAVLKASGAEPKDIVRTTVYLTDMGTFDVVNGIYSMIVDKPYPSRVCIQVSKIPKGAKIMVDAVAYCGN